jgi:hypothetical protein
MKAAQEYFGIVSDQHNADAAALVLSDGMCKIKGDLLLIEMAVNEVPPCTVPLSCNCCGPRPVLTLLQLHVV